MLSLPRTAAPHAGAGAVLKIIRATGRSTRAELAEATGLSRSTLSDRLDALMASELVREAGLLPSNGGRPRGTLELNPSGGLLLVADVGATRTRLALLDLAATALGEVSETIAVADGPSAVLERITEVFGGLLRSAGRREEELRGIALGLPGPVSFATGRPVHPPLMPGWHEFPVRDWFVDRYSVPVVVDNDVNLMAFGEQQTWFDDCAHLLFVQVGAGIGCGICANGRILRGAEGAAGDVGHIRVGGRDEARCNCGNQGCLEAVAGGATIAARLADAGREATGSEDVARLANAADPLANRLVREAGRYVGEVLAGCVSLFNPGAIVIGGPLMQAPQPLLAGVREVTIGRSPPLATRHLRVVPSRLGERAGVVGAGLLLCEHVLAPAAIDRALELGATRRTRPPQ
jgi:predicted NBD/HSP70 family sugar kinase